MNVRVGRRLACGLACAAIFACSQDRPGTPSLVVYDVDVAPILQAHCATCHGDTAPAARWSVITFLGTIACVAPSNAPATQPASTRAPILMALTSAPHLGLLGSGDVAILTSWVLEGTPAYRAGVHDPSIVDPRSAGFHGTLLRASHWSPMLDATDPNACGRCHAGTPATPAGVTFAAPGAPDCTSCHDQPGGVLACPTCHGSGTVSYPPRDPCFFAGTAFDVGGLHAAHVQPSPIRSPGLPCSTCHPAPGDPVIGGSHGDGKVEITFDSILTHGPATYDASSGACSVSCHQLGGTRPNVTWTQSPAAVGCNDCHLSPPANHYTGPCTGCHSEANASGTALTPGPLHINGKVDLGNGSGECGACHGSGNSPWPATRVHAAHQNPVLTEPLACSSCHVVPATILDPMHLDGTVHVVFGGLATARGASPSWDGVSCTNVACHGANLADPAAVPVWSDTSGVQSQCGACHGIPPSEHTPSATCNQSGCHGTEITFDTSGAPLVSAVGKILHVDGIVEPMR